MLLLEIGLGLGLESDCMQRVMVSNSHSRPCLENRLKSHVTVDCRVINHHPS